MTEVKKQLKNVLESERHFTLESEEKVFEKIAAKERKRVPWKVPAAAFAMICICVFSYFIIANNQKVQHANPMFDAIVIDESYNVLIDKKNVWQERDALLAYTTEEQPSVIVTKYFVYENGKWQQLNMTTLNTENYLEWTNHGNLYSGIADKERITEIMLDNQQVIKANSEYYQYWVGYANSEVAQVKYQYEDGNVLRVQKSYDDDELMLGYVPAAPVDRLEKYYEFSYSANNMDQGDEQYMKYDLIVDSSEKRFKRGDVALYVNDKGEEVVSRIAAFPGEMFAAQNGTLMIDNQPLNVLLGYAKVYGHTTLENVKKNDSFHSYSEQQVKDALALSFDETALQLGQYAVVPDNWLTGKIEVINDSQIRGKVLGYSPFELAHEWTTEEGKLFTSFQKTHDKSLLKGVNQQTIGRLYVYAWLIGDYETEYQLMVDNPEAVMWSQEEHVQMKLDAKPANPAFLIELAQNIKNSRWVDTEPNHGYLVNETTEPHMYMQMSQNNDGIWQVNFLWGQ